MICCVYRCILIKRLYIIIFDPQPPDEDRLDNRYYFHFIDGETEVWSLRNLPKSYDLNNLLLQLPISLHVTGQSWQHYLISSNDLQKSLLTFTLENLRGIICVTQVDPTAGPGGRGYKLNSCEGQDSFPLPFSKLLSFCQFQLKCHLLGEACLFFSKETDIFYSSLLSVPLGTCIAWYKYYLSIP